MRLSDRRNFLKTLVGGLAATAAVRTWPFRVYSFPTVVSPRLDKYLQAAVESLNRDIQMDFYLNGAGLYVNNPLSHVKLYNVEVPLPDDIKEMLHAPLG